MTNKQEIEEKLRRLQTLEAFAQTSYLFSDMTDKSMKRPFWYLRPSHHKLMNIWKFHNEMYGQYLEKYINHD